MSGIAACLFVRNAEHDIQEWISYHHLIGVTSFIIYDNGSTDATILRAKSMSSVCDIRLFEWSHATTHRAQLDAYEDCIDKFKHEFEWILILDSDEFLATTGDLSLPSMLKTHFFSAGIAFNWACYGSSGHVETPSGLTTEAFTYRAEEHFGPNEHTKMIVRPEAVRKVENPHYLAVDGPVVRPDGRAVVWDRDGITKTVELSDWRINHYFVRSKSQWDFKLARGYRDAPVRTADWFQAYDRNEIHDQLLVKYSGPIRDLIDKATMSRRPPEILKREKLHSFLKFMRLH